MDPQNHGAQQVSFLLPAELVEYLAPYANRVIENNYADSLKDYHQQRLELPANLMLTYEQWHATDYVKGLRAHLATKGKPESLPHYRYLEALYEEYKAAFKAMHGRRPGRAYRKPPSKASFAWALGIALMDYARTAKLKAPPRVEEPEIQGEDWYAARAMPEAQMALLLEADALPLHKMRPRTLSIPQAA